MRTLAPTLARSALRGVAMKAPGVSISSTFDAGNIEVVSISDDVQLKIKPDPYTELEKKHHFQWFAFRAVVSAAITQPVKYSIVNAGDASYADAWAGSKVCYSTDMRTWQRVESTTYDATKGALCWDFDHSAAPSVIFSYFDLYPYERQLALVADCAAAGAAGGSLGQTLDGRELDVVQAVYNHLQWLHAPRASRRR